jgi:hypothetical protein
LGSASTKRYLASAAAPGALELSISPLRLVLACRGARGLARISSAKACIAGSIIPVLPLLFSPLGAADRMCQPALRAVDVDDLTAAGVRVKWRLAPTLPLSRAAARTRARLPEIKGRGRPTRSSGGRSIG